MSHVAVGEVGRYLGAGGDAFTVDVGQPVEVDLQVKRLGGVAVQPQRRSALAVDGGGVRQRPGEAGAASFIAHTEASTGSQLPRFIKDGFDAFFECGILAHGFLRLRSPAAAGVALRDMSAPRDKTVRQP